MLGVCLLTEAKYPRIGPNMVGATLAFPTIWVQPKARLGVSPRDSEGQKNTPRASSYVSRETGRPTSNHAFIQFELVDVHANVPVN